MKGSLTVVVCVLLSLSILSCKEKAKGIMAIQDGNEIKMGVFVDDKLSGLGLISNGPDNIESIGSWKGGAIDGLGMRVNKIFTDIGEFSNGSMNGKGIKKSVSGDVYLGNFVADNYQGKGVLFYADGRTYTGTFQNNIPEGNGIMQSPGGNVYIGAFKNGMYEGNGILILKNGSRWEGKFAHNDPADSARFYDHR